MFLKSAHIAFAASLLFFVSIGINGQSTLQDHPTPIVRNELSGTIKARDLGDSRLTTYYYWFEGAQGDVFLNLITKNFTGDIDVFAQNGLKSLTKIVVFADFGEIETGRVIYLRKPERLLLRVQGRSPNEEAATFRFKFAGSFVAASATEEVGPELPKVPDSTTAGVRVNSAGAILPPIPKPPEIKETKDTKLETQAEADKTPVVQKTEPTSSETEEKKVVTEVAEEKKADEKPEVVITDPLKESDTSKAAEAPKKTTATSRNTRQRPAKKTAIVTKPPAEPVDAVKDLKETSDTAKAIVEEGPKLDPLANVHLVILFKDGAKIERPLLEVEKFSVDRGVLTVVNKKGHVGKYQMVDVAKVTIE
ncbi:MAG: hypothetical protein ACJ72Z_13905 [Pyrinomonadaceae bacterium]